MSVLHIVNSGPQASFSLQRCLARMGKDDSLLLIEDAVYAAALLGNEEAVGRKIYALEPDMALRGLSVENRLAGGLELVDYAGFVALAASHERVLSWN